MYEFYTLGNTIMSVYWLIYGLITGIILCMAMYMFLSSRSGFSSVDYPTSIPLRRAAGIIFTTAALELLISLCIVTTIDQFTVHNVPWYLTDWGASSLQQLLALLFVPSFCYFLQAVLQGENKFRMGVIVFAMSFPLFLLVWTVVHGLSHADDFGFSAHILLIVRVYWAFFTVNVLYFYIKAVKRYERHLHDLYSEVSNRQVRWLYMLGVLNTGYIFWFILVCVTDIPFHTGAMIEHVFALGITVYTFYHVDRQQQILWNVNNEDSSEKEIDTPVMQELDKRIKEWVENKEYLNPDCTRDDMVRALNTNRTYLNMYLNKHDSTFYKFVNTYRINYAISLMNDEHNPRKLLDIAIASGFKSLEVFSRQFKTITGKLPSQYGGGRKNSLEWAKI